MYDQSSAKRHCPNCDHYPMYPLVRFIEDDVNEDPTADAMVPNIGFMRLFPRAGLMVVLVSWVVNLFVGKARVVSGKAKIRKAREEILPRSPNSLVCPNCYEVLERM